MCTEGTEKITVLSITQGGTLSFSFIKVIVPVFIVHWCFKRELQFSLDGSKHIRGIIPFGYSTEGATCKMLMLLLRSQVESAFKKLDIRYIRYNLQCVIILMCIQLCAALHAAYLSLQPTALPPTTHTLGHFTSFEIARVEFF